MILGLSQRLAADLLCFLSLVAAGKTFCPSNGTTCCSNRFLAIFLRQFSRVWLFRWLLFRLMFLSGAVKLLSHDAAWRGLTALRYHYRRSRCRAAGLVFSSIAGWFQTFSVVIMFVVELAITFTILPQGACGSSHAACSARFNY
jgi:hypothetical protein